MWGFAHRSPRALEVTPKHEELFRDADDPAEAITRETSQNSADAKSHSANRVRMRFAHVALTRSDFEAQWLSGLRDHMNAWRSGLAADAFASDVVDCLVIEDFGTTGLEGALNSPGGAFYAFWRQYGESPKAGNTGGRHGVGKSTLAGASKARMFFGLTVRESDKSKLLMGQTILGPHELNGQKYEAYGEFSPTTGDHMPKPFEGPTADQFAVDFKLERTDEPGLSLVVPAVRAGVVENDLEAVKRALVANCFPQVASKLLEFDVAGELLTRETLAAWAARYSDLALSGAVEVALAASSPATIWTAKSAEGDLSADSFSEDELSEMRSAFTSGELVTVRVPVRIKQRSGPEETGWMRLHIKKTGGKVPRAEHYARSRLTVPKQRKVLAGHETIGLLLAEDGPLSNFLGSAEPPSHARWTHQNLRDRARYSNTQTTLSRVATLIFGEVVRAVRPLWFIMENVPEARGSKAWQAARHLLGEAGYGISEVTLNAAFYGVPQVRKRFLAVGRLDVEDGFLSTALEERLANVPMTVRDFVGSEFEVDFYYRHPRNWGRRAVFSIDEPSPTVRSTNRPVPPGYKAHPLDPAPHANVRPLTPHERARIQTFPKEHRFEKITSHLDTMIANAVPVKLAEHVGKVIRRYEEGSRLRPEDEFRAWLRDRHDYTPRAAGDVLSRLRRAKRLLGEDDEHFREPQDGIQRLRSTAEYLALPAAVKSQIKRAIELQAEFRASDII